ncbi:MAG: helix-turn-helix domain-containing protein, partial [Alphaproteobacteria bacterium]
MRAPLKQKQYHLLEKKMKKLKKLYESDMTLVEIAKDLKVSKSTLEQKIKELGWKRKPCYQKKSVNINKLKELLSLGLSDKKIQEKLHIGRIVLVRCKKELGIYLEDEGKVLKGKKGFGNREYYKKTGGRPIPSCASNILEKHFDEVIALLKQGTLRTEIAKKYGVSRSTVFNFINLYGIQAPVKRILDGHEQFIKQSFYEGKSLEEIAAKLKCSASSVARFIKNNHFNRSQKIVLKNSYMNNQKDKIQELFLQGDSYDEIAQKLGVRRASVYQFIKRFKVTTPER